jgi:hypothetical protein
LDEVGGDRMKLEAYVQQLLGTDEPLFMEIEPSFILFLPEEETQDDD